MTSFQIISGEHAKITPVRWIQSGGSAYIELPKTIGHSSTYYAAPHLRFECPVFTGEIGNNILVNVNHGSSSWWAISLWHEDNSIKGLKLTSYTGYQTFVNEWNIQLQNIIDPLTRHKLSIMSCDFDKFSTDKVKYCFRVDNNEKFYVEESGMGALIMDANARSSVAKDTHTCIFGAGNDLGLYPIGVKRSRIRLLEFNLFTFESFANKKSGNPVIISNYIPALKDGMAGLYETMTGKFYGNSASSGRILWGND